MCGFLGIVDGTDTDVDLRGLEPRITRQLLQRGPDVCKAHRSPGYYLAHSRLSITDESSAADQPFTSAEQAVYLLFNGEIYNYEALRARLPKQPFATSSDTEVLFRLYETFGPSALNLLDGMFSLAILDLRHRRVVLARDAVGKKPLYFATCGEQLAFSSDASLLGAYYRAPLSPAAIGYYIRQGFSDPAASIYETVHPVRPGEVLTWALDGDKSDPVRSRLSPTLPGVETDGDLVDVVDAAVREAVEKRLSNVKRPVIFLSGGLDSTLVAKYLREGFDRIDALTMKSPLPWELDYPYAKAAAAHYGLRLEPVSYPVTGLSDRLDDFVMRQDEPMGVLSFLPLAFMSAGAIGSSKIVFTGDGGDEVFFGYDSTELWTDAVDDGAPSVVTSGPDMPDWVGAKGRRQATESLVGHSFARLDRAVSEMGLEARCPLCDYPLMELMRAQPRERVLATPKQLVKEILLRDLPDEFVNRPKIGFATRIKYYQALDGFRFIRSRIRPELKTFLRDSGVDAPDLSYDPTAADVFRAFPRYWTLAVLSSFLTREGRF